jgi:hypothetical protein
MTSQAMVVARLAREVVVSEELQTPNIVRRMAEN